MDTRATSPAVQRCLDNAFHCERLSIAARDRDARAAFADAAAYWRDLAGLFLQAEKASLDRSLDRERVNLSREAINDSHELLKQVDNRVAEDAQDDRQA